MKKMEISSEALKWFALLAMTADHIDSVWLKMGWLSSTLGRMAFPVFSFLLISNLKAYSPVKKYLWRLGSFALVTQLSFYLFHFRSFNVLFSFFYAILFINLLKKVCQLTSSLLIQAYFCILFLAGLLPFIWVADYGFQGFLFLISLYAYLNKNSKLNYMAVLLASSLLNCGSILKVFITLMTVVVLLSCINVVKGRRIIKWWFFYLYYPLHKLVLYMLKIM